MRKLDFNDIQKFYHCYQEQIGQSIASNLTDQIIDQICNDTVNKINSARKTIKQIINTYKGNPQLDSISFPAILTLLLDQNCVTQFLEVTDDKINPDCGLNYFSNDDPQGDRKSVV